MRVAIVCPYDLGAAGGVQQLCHELAERLRVTGDEVVLAGPGSGRQWTSLGSAVPVSANGSRVPISLSPFVRRRFEKAVSGADVVHLHEPLVPLVGWAGLRQTTPMVVTFHADPPLWARRLYKSAPPGIRRTFRSRTKTAVSDVARSAVPPSWGEAQIVPNAIDVASYVVDEERRPKRVVFLGRDDPRKGLDILLQAWPAVTRTHPDAELVVIGARRSEGPAGVRFLGRVSDMEKRHMLASAAVFAAPNTHGESFGMVVAEALAAGCAVVASDMPAFRAVAGDGARFAHPGDVAHWSEVISGLLGAPDQVAVLAGLGRQIAERYDWSRVVVGYRDAYREALGSS